jgi:hypothetical protein
MIVAWQFIARKACTEKIRPVGNGMTNVRGLVRRPGSTNTTARSDHTAPYGAGPDLVRFLAINCGATIIQSLRDSLSTIHPSLLASHAVSRYPSQPRNPISPAVATTINGFTLVKMKTAEQTAVRR